MKYKDIKSIEKYLVLIPTMYNLFGFYVELRKIIEVQWYYDQIIKGTLSAKIVKKKITHKNYQI